MTPKKRDRILVVVDDRSIDDEYRKILGRNAPNAAWERGTGGFSLTSAYHGSEALETMRRAVMEAEPFALAFVDVHEPCGSNGLEIAHQLWESHPDLQVAIGSFPREYGWSQIVAAFGNTDRLSIVGKPLDPVEVLQCATASVCRRRAQQDALALVRRLDRAVLERTIELEQAMEIMRAEARGRERIAGELRLAQKLEAVGRLASGIGHEINTPIQYVSDSMYFLNSVNGELRSLYEEYRRALESAANGADARPLWRAIQAREAEIGLGTIREEIPRAYERAFEGVQRVADIVRAMKEFAHPATSEQTLADINHAIETTLAVARNEYKYVASVRTELGALPEVMCNVGELNQVFLNLIVNAAHALADAGRDPSTGEIVVATSAERPWVDVEVRDNGCGIPAENLEKIYDPFFTTKEVGRGSGQGLAIARSIVVDKHGGTIGVTSGVGEGTAFRIRLPIEGKASTPEAEPARRAEQDTRVEDLWGSGEGVQCAAFSS
jgi:two-component system, NtrC family, sensor kinase